MSLASTTSICCVLTISIWPSNAVSDEGTRTANFFYFFYFFLHRVMLRKGIPEGAK